MGDAIHLPRRADAGIKARQALVDIATDMDEPLNHDLRLLVTELIANRVRSPAAGPASWLELEVSVEPETVRVELNDVGPRWVFDPAPFTYEPEDSTGWGIYLVDRLSDRWGISRAESAISIWFELDRD